MSPRVQEFIDKWSKKENLIKVFPESYQKLATRIFIILFFSFILASAFSSFIVPFIMSFVIESQQTKGASAVDMKAQAFALKNGLNLRDIKKAVLDRNIFNLDGEFPDESQDKKDSKDLEEDEISSFDEFSPCVKSKLTLTLVGTIYMGVRSENSTATIKSVGQTEVDIYKMGDAVLDMENVSISEIQRNRVVFNNQGKIECIEIEDKIFALLKKSKNKNPSKNNQKGGIIGSPQTVELTSSWVESELGDGFSQIINSARFIPNAEGGRVNGFKIFKITPGSLLSKVGFKDGDVVTKVNSIEMTAEQGFALYQAFQDEKEIRIELLRAGTEPLNITVQIK